MNIKFTSPLTVTQQQIWFDCELNPTSKMYLSSYVFTLEGNVDESKVENAWYQLIDLATKN